MMGERRVMQEALFYGFSLERHVPDKHLLRKIDRQSASASSARDRFVDLSEVRTHLEPYYSETGRPSIGYCFGIRSERRLCEEVHLNLAYRSLTVAGNAELCAVG